MKEKGISPVSLLRYKLSNIFVGRSMYMQRRTGSFKEAFSKNTFYRFLNSAKTNWLRFTSLLAADIVNNDIKGLTNDSRKKTQACSDKSAGSNDDPVGHCPQCRNESGVFITVQWPVFRCPPPDFMLLIVFSNTLISTGFET